MLKIPDAPNEPLSGFAGKLGNPVRLGSQGIEPDGVSLFARIRRVGGDIRRLRQRVRDLEARTSPSGDRG